MSKIVRYVVVQVCHTVVVVVVVVVWQWVVVVLISLPGQLLFLSYLLTEGITAEFAWHLIDQEQCNDRLAWSTVFSKIYQLAVK